MKGMIGFMLLLMVKTASAQFYYKDIVLTRQAIEKWKAYKKEKVTSVKLISLQANGEPTEGFECEQAVAPDFSSINTFSQSSTTPASNLTAFYDSRGLLSRTIDTSDTYRSVTDYAYDAGGNIESITNVSTQTDNHITDSEKHIWTYNQNGSPVSMIKVKENTDTTYVQFKSDEKGNIIEERPEHKGVPLPVVYYYYNDDNLLTDIVRYNVKAHRLLPDYMFEYDHNGRISSMLFVSAGINDYQKWLYQYNEKDLKSGDSCYDKRKELLGRIEYQYSYK